MDLSDPDDFIELAKEHAFDAVMAGIGVAVVLIAAMILWSMLKQFSDTKQQQREERWQNYCDWVNGDKRGRWY